jgi:transcriptional regulator with XRE-family HTH domain
MKQHPAYGSILLVASLTPEQIGSRIAQARVRRGWTQMQFAIEANVSVSTVQRWESGHLPPVRELFRIAPLLGVEPDQLVEVSRDDEVAVIAERVERAVSEAAERLSGEIAALADRVSEIEQRRSARGSGSSPNRR